MSATDSPPSDAAPAQANKLSLVWTILLAAAAGGMGWGIRGQYGHQTGAMIAGVLVGLVFALRVFPNLSSRTAAQAVAFFTLGISIGGSMTYGQTLGLSHDADLIGNWQALRWGLLGTAVKGAVWIGLGGLFLGIALSGQRYSVAELGLMLASAILVRFVGIEWLNEPYVPSAQTLPTIYFSDHWFWEPNAELKPRRELWGGLWCALVGLTAYAGLLRRDGLAVRLALWGIVAGAIGFTAGQSLQAWHAWNLDWIRQDLMPEMDPLLNWWNLMEITFGATFAAILGFGLWLNRAAIGSSMSWRPQAELTGAVECAFLALHVCALVAWSFYSFDHFDVYADIGFTMILLPLLACVAGRYWPYWMLMPVVMVPIAGKTIRQTSFESDFLSGWIAWPLFVCLPLAITWALSHLCAMRSLSSKSIDFARAALLVLPWIYFGLNFVFFELPWPWQTWTGRTPSACVFLLASCLLSLGCLTTVRQPIADESQD